MNLRDLLAKLGILRVGTKKAVWHSGKDLPEEFLMDNVMDAKRDLTTRQDLKEVKQAVAGRRSPDRFCTKCGKPVAAGQKFCTSCGTEIASR
ncbi:MAG: zinc ribbon domain-containing protein [Notoacmeibacter sp.]|nr:zinc ribbon domain-containing protein [Notoacmeibacter sp.]